MLEFLIGRGECDIVLESDAVSARHAVLMFVDDGSVAIRDTQSRNGSFLRPAGIGAETQIGPSPVQVQLDNVLRFGDESLRVSDLIMQLLEMRPAARSALASSWRTPDADRMLAAYGGRVVILNGDQEKPDARKKIKSGKVSIDPNTGGLVRE